MDPNHFFERGGGRKGRNPYVYAEENPFPEFEGKREPRGGRKSNLLLGE